MHGLVDGIGKKTERDQRKEPSPFEQPAETEHRFSAACRFIRVVAQSSAHEVNTEGGDEASAYRDAELTYLLNRHSHGYRNT